MNRRKRRADRGNTLGLVGIFCIVITLAIVVTVKGQSLMEKDLIYQEKEEKLEAMLKAEEERSVVLEEQRIYVQTKQYIEKVAKEKLGLVNKDEILLKPSQK